MSFARVVMMMLLGSAVVIGFVLPPSKEEPAVSADSPFPRQRCPDESLQSIRKSLLSALNMQAEPQLPAGMMDAVRKQWQRTFSVIPQSAKDTTAFEHSASSNSGNSTGLQCCSVVSEIVLKDLGWDSWVIHPLTLTTVQCAVCNPVDNSVKCPSSSSSSSSVLDANSQDNSLCCGPTSQEMAPIVYMDETGTVVISSVQVTRSCGCGAGNIQQQGTN